MGRQYGGVERHLNLTSLLTTTRSPWTTSTDGWWGGTPGLGGVNFFTGQFFKMGVPTEMESCPICDLELAAHVLCALIWGHEWSGLDIWGLTDSEPCEFFLKNGRSRSNRRLQMGRTFASLQLWGNFVWHPDGVRSVANVLPDCASRWRQAERRETFWRTCRDLNINPVERSITAEMFKALPICSR